MAKHVVEVILEGVNHTGKAFKEANQGLNSLISANKMGAGVIAAGLTMMSKKLVDMGIASVKAFSEFDYGVRRAAALSGEGEDAYDKLREAAIKYGQATMFTGKQVGEAETMMTMAGLTAEETVKSLSSVLDLAAASDIDLAEATGFVVNTMRAFGREAKEMRSIVDVMTNTVTSSALNMTQLGEALTYVSASANTLGVSIPEVSAAIGVLADTGIKGSVAGAGMRMGFIRLAKGLGISEDSATGAKAAFEKLGLTVDQITFGEGIRKGSLDLVKTLELMEEKTADLGRLAKLSLFAEMFGSRAANQMMQMGANLDSLKEKTLSNEAASFKHALTQTKAWEMSGESFNALQKSIGGDANAIDDLVSEMDLGIEAATAFAKFMNAGAQETNALTTAFKSANTASSIITEMNKSLEYMNRILKGVVATAVEQFGAALAPVVVLVTKKLTALLEQFNKFTQTKIGKNILKITVALLGLIAVAGAVTAAIIGIQLTMGFLGSMLGVVALLFIKVIAVMALLAAIGYVLYKAWQKNIFGIQDIVSGLWKRMKIVFGGIKTVVKAFITTFVSGMQPVIKAVKGFVNSISGGFKDSESSLNNFSSIVSRVAKGMAGAATFIAKVYAAMYTHVISNFLMMAKFWVQVWKSFVTAFKPAMSAIKELWNIIADSFSVFDSAGGEATSFSDVIMKVFDVIWKVIQPVAKALGWFIGTVIGGLVRGIVWLVKAWKKLEELPGIGGAFKVLGTMLLFIINPIMEIIKGIVTLVGWFKKLKPYAENIGKVLALAFLPLIGTVMAVVYVFKKLKELWTKGLSGEGPLAGIVNAAMTMLSAIKQVWAGIKQYFGGIYQQFKGVFQMIVGLFSGNKGMIKDGFINLFEGTKSTLIGLGKVILGVLKYTLWGIPKMIMSIFKLVPKIIIGWNKLIFKAIFGLVKVLSKIFTWENIKSGFSTIWSGITSWFSSLSTKFTTAGKDLITSFISGLVSSASALYDSLKGILGKVKNMLGGLWDKFVTKIAPVVAPIVDTLKPIAQPMTENLTPVLSPMLDMIKPIIDSPILKPIIDSATQIAQPTATEMPVASAIDQPVQTGGSVTSIKEGDIKIDLSGVKIANNMDISAIAQKLASLLKKERRLNYG